VLMRPMLGAEYKNPEDFRMDVDKLETPLSTPETSHHRVTTQDKSMESGQGITACNLVVTRSGQNYADVSMEKTEDETEVIQNLLR